MPKEPSKLEQLKQELALAEQVCNRFRADANPDHVAAMITARRSKIAVLEKEIADIETRHAEAPAKLERTMQSVKNLRQQLAQHENRHDVSRLDKLAKDLSKLSPEELQKLLAQLGGNQ